MAHGTGKHIDPDTVRQDKVVKKGRPRQNPEPGPAFPSPSAKFRGVSCSQTFGSGTLPAPFLAISFAIFMQHFHGNAFKAKRQFYCNYSSNLGCFSSPFYTLGKPLRPRTSPQEAFAEFVAKFRGAARAT